LIEASFNQAQLQGARFDCPETIKVAPNGRVERQINDAACTKLQSADFTEASLQGAIFDHASLQGAVFVRAMLQGASLISTDLSGATLSSARLEGASLSQATLLGTSWLYTQAQGVNLREANLTAAAFLRTQLQGADMRGATLQYAVFNAANLYRASAELPFEEVILVRVSLSPSFPRLRYRQRRIETSADAEPETLDDRGYRTLLDQAVEGVTDSTLILSIRERLYRLDPRRGVDEGDSVLAGSHPLNSDAQRNSELRIKRYQALDVAMCGEANAPFVARGLIYNGRVLGSTMEGGHLIERLRDQATCPGAQGLTPSDYQKLLSIEKQVESLKRQDQTDQSGDSSDK
jgi:uncharacterized protein YjbI with pentapeptide repeats